ncbi:hypothetical protein EMPG_14526, partial [Blastomyces silverae]
VSTTPATPIRTPFAARLRAQQQVRTEPRQFSHNRGSSSVHTRRSSLGAIVRFADVDDDDDDNDDDAGDGDGDGDDGDGDVGDDPESPTNRRSTNRPS